MEEIPQHQALEMWEVLQLVIMVAILQHQQALETFPLVLRVEEMDGAPTPPILHRAQTLPHLGEPQPQCLQTHLTLTLMD